MRTFLTFVLLGLAQWLPLPAAAQMRIGWQVGDVSTVLTLAVERKIFEAQGLSVELRGFPAGPAMLPALAAGEIDVAWMGEFPTTSGYANGLPIEVILVPHMHRTHIRLIGNPANGIRSIADLKGKKIGVTIGSTSHHHLIRALSMAKLTPRDVTMVNLAPANMVPAYVSGQVDAIVTWEPGAGEVEARGGLRLATTESIGSITGILWVARSEYVQKHPLEIQKFLHAWEKATDEYRRNPMESMKYEAKRLNQSVDELAKLTERQSIVFPTYSEQLSQNYLGKKGEQADARLMKHMQSVAAFLHGIDRIKEVPGDWSRLIDVGPLTTYQQSKAGSN
ncbi:taurine ABC transporter substrate-binding protein [Variovorax sp. PBL-E5]|uniref:taurine ABC transporter substrate-binding protein n=1 Tax=Variovorax sp. PBL-E5 TaxID=434014 RepID=UPI0013A55510|nr:NrtA/SsuA/CpmA family ABC transporter substrate-binding protein [Variovorax sp. PBL-E5]